VAHFARSHGEFDVEAARLALGLHYQGAHEDRSLPAVLSEDFGLDPSTYAHGYGLEDADLSIRDVTTRIGTDPDLSELLGDIQSVLGVPAVDVEPAATLVGDDYRRKLRLARRQRRSRVRSRRRLPRRLQLSDPKIGDAVVRHDHEDDVGYRADLHSPQFQYSVSDLRARRSTASLQGERLPSLRTIPRRTTGYTETYTGYTTRVTQSIPKSDGANYHVAVEFGGPGSRHSPWAPP